MRQWLDRTPGKVVSHSSALNKNSPGQQGWPNRGADRPRGTRSRTWVWERHTALPSCGCERLGTHTSFPLPTVRGISIPKLRPSRLFYLHTYYHLWHYEPNQEKSTAERTWTWSSSEGEGKDRKEESVVESGDGGPGSDSASELMNALKQVSSSHWAHFTPICRLRMVDQVCAS